MVWPRRGASYLTSIVSQVEEINFDSSIPVTRDVDSELILTCWVFFERGHT